MHVNSAKNIKHWQENGIKAKESEKYKINKAGISTRLIF